MKNIWVKSTPHCTRCNDDRMIVSNVTGRVGSHHTNKRYYVCQTCGKRHLISEH